MLEVIGTYQKLSENWYMTLESVRDYQRLSEVIGIYWKLSEMSESRKAHRGTQRERVLVHKKQIVALLENGVSMPTIQERIGLEDIPYSTFHYHTRKLRDAANISLYGPPKTAREDAAEPPSYPPVSTQNERVNPASNPIAPPQPEREAMEKEKQEKPSGYDPNKRQRRI